MSASTKYIETRTVAHADLDALEHVNNLQYLRWTLNAASAHSSQVGWPASRYRELGMGWVVRSHKITYKFPAKLNDEIAIHTWIKSFDKVTSIRKYEIIRQSDSRVCALAETRWVFVDFETLKLIEIPNEIRAAFGVK
jgi:acyl-CoA thioester hydrolase